MRILLFTLIVLSTKICCGQDSASAVYINEVVQKIETRVPTDIMEHKDTSIFDLIETDNGSESKLSFWDIIKDARDFAEELKNKGLTVYLNIKGKETLIIGKKAKPSISQILSKSKNIEIKNIIETAKMSKEILD